MINDLRFIIEDLKTQKQQKVHYDRLKKFKFRQPEYQKQGKLAKRLAGHDEKVDGFIEIEVKQQSAGVSDQGTKTEELPSQIEVNPEVGQSDEGFLEPKPENETLMDTVMEAKSNDRGAQPTSSNKTKLNSTPSETSSKTKTATQGKPITVQQEIMVKITVVQKRSHEVQVDKQVMEKTQTGNQDLAE